jgi:hypothetical protein
VETITLLKTVREKSLFKKGKSCLKLHKALIDVWEIANVKPAKQPRAQKRETEQTHLFLTMPDTW